MLGGCCIGPHAAMLLADISELFEDCHDKLFRNKNESALAQNQGCYMKTH